MALRGVGGEPGKKSDGIWVVAPQQQRRLQGRHRCVRCNAFGARLPPSMTPWLAAVHHAAMLLLHVAYSGGVPDFWTRKPRFDRQVSWAVDRRVLAVQTDPSVVRRPWQRRHTASHPAGRDAASAGGCALRAGNDCGRRAERAVRRAGKAGRPHRRHDARCVPRLSLQRDPRPARVEVRV